MDGEEIIITTMGKLKAFKDWPLTNWLISYGFKF